MTLHTRVMALVTNNNLEKKTNEVMFVLKTLHIVAVAGGRDRLRLFIFLSVLGMLPMPVVSRFSANGFTPVSWHFSFA